MKVKIKRIDKTLPMPEYHTTGSVAFDLYARETTVIKARSIGRIPANFIVEIPKGYMLTVVTRSSTPMRKGLSVPHGIGIVDQDYHGEQDELAIQVYNFTEQDVTVERKERVGQAAFMRVDIAEWEEVNKMSDVSRGGWGSTG